VSMRSLSMSIALAWLGAVVFSTLAAAAPSDPVRVLIEDPARGEPVRNDVHQAPISGTAIAQGERPLDIDVVIVIDVSGSTAEASGVDVDEDGQIGFNPSQELIAPGTYPPDTVCTDPEDTILAAEIKAADFLIQSLDASRLRVGVVSFSGEVDPISFKQAVYGQQDAWVETPLTSDFSEARRALANILARGPHGGTNFAAGVRLAVTELAGLMGAKSASRPEAKKIVMFLTDGVPSFPFGRSNVSDPGDTEAALNAARVAHKAGVTINTYALGQTALTNPLAATELSRITLGTFTPVQNPGDVITYLQGVSFANVDDVIFTNLTTSEISEDVRLSPDGSFSGYVPVREGTNRVRVTALATDGSEGSVEFDLEFEVSGLSGRELALELERIRKRNKELQLLIENERIQRFRAKQRKDLKLEAEERE
jgi:Mg-chelatase subunit ChlD